MKIYTKSGDSGETGLLGGKRISKDSLRITAYGSVDELNALLGWIRCDMEKDRAVKRALKTAVSRFILPVQNELFSLGAALASPSSSGLELPVTEGDILRIERTIDGWEKDLKPLRNFILPGSGPHSARLHLARTVTRRAERYVVALSRTEDVPCSVVPYLNRLSDAFFVLSRWVASRSGEKEVLWKKENKK